MKKGFLVYFDNCRQTKELPDDQYAALWRALFEYAERLAGDGDAEAFLEEQSVAMPVLSAVTLRFIAGNIRRDHQRYQERAEELQAAQKRKAVRKEPSAGQRNAPSTDADAWKYV